jgi:hypothetical protein
MSPKHRQIRAPHPTASGNAFQAHLDPSHDAINRSLDGGDEKHDGSDGITDENADTCNSGPPEPQHHLQFYVSVYIKMLKELCDHAQETIENIWGILRDSQGYPEKQLHIVQTMASTVVTRGIAHACYKATIDASQNISKHTDTITQHNDECLNTIQSKIYTLLKKIDTAWIENTALYKACYASHKGRTM